MKQKLTLALVLLLLISLFAGCGSSASPKEANMTAASTPMANAKGVMSKTEESYGYSYDTAAAEYATEAEMPMPAPTITQDNLGGSMPNFANVKLIYTANISLETTEFDDATSKLTALVSSLGGYFENSSVNNYSNYRYGSYTVRVPAEQFDSFCTQVSGLCQLTYISRSAEDVSESYYDTESRLLTQKTKLERLQDLLSKAENMEDIITLESAISDTEWTIENLTGTLRHYDSLVGYSTVYLDLREVYKLTDVEQPVIGFGARFVSALKRGCGNFVSSLQSLLISFAYNWIGWLIVVVIVVVVIALLRRRARRKREREEAYLRQFTAPEKKDTDETPKA